MNGVSVELKTIEESMGSSAGRKSIASTTGPFPTIPSLVVPSCGL